MNKTINKILVTGVCALAACVPFSVDAATLTQDRENRTNDKGVLKLPLILETGEKENIPSLELTCTVDDIDVACSFEKSDNTLLRDNVFTYVDGETTGNVSFPHEKTTIGYLVLTNEQAATKSVKFSVTSKTKNVTSDITDMKADIKAKEVEKPKSNDASLKTLKVSQGTMVPEFNPDVTEYTVYNIADTIKSVNINHECKTGSCYIELAAPAGKEGLSKANLNQGENKITLTVTSEDESATKVYTLNVIRGESTFNSSKLKSLEFLDHDLTPAFNKNVLEYNLTIPNNITSVVNILKYTKEDEKSNIALDGFENLVVGDNKATITIDNSTGSETTTYVINIKRMNDTNIEVIKYINNQVTFRTSDGIQNTLDEAEFKTQYADAWEKIENKTYQFDEQGNLIVETKKEEPIKKKTKNNTLIIVIIIIVGLLIIVISGILIFKKKKPTEEETKKDETTKETEEVKTEEKAPESEETNETLNIDEALVDLMSMKKYDFKDDE